MFAVTVFVMPLPSSIVAARIERDARQRGGQQGLVIAGSAERAAIEVHRTALPVPVDVIEPLMLMPDANTPPLRLRSIVALETQTRSARWHRCRPP
jgi:hypothetical protein